MMKWIIRVILLGVLAAAGWIGWRYFTAEPTLEIKTAAIETGPLTLTVTATGRLAPTTEVLVGCEISGTVGEILVEHNDRVEAGQIICRLRPELLNAEFEQAQAELARAEASVEQLKVQEAEARRQLERVEKLRAEGHAPEEEYLARKAAHAATVANTKAGEAAVQGARSLKELAESRLGKSVITSPIGGVVLDVRVDVGQTVAAALMAPELFVLAEDLSRMELMADVSEADVGYICPGQTTVFRVNAYRDRDFHGIVRQVRNQPRSVGSVVTYTVVIDVVNRDLLLRPGMPTDIDIEIVRREETAKISNAALRFRPPLPPDDIRRMLESLEWPTRPEPIDVSALARPHALTKPGELEIVPPPLEANKSSMWQFENDQWKPVPVWTTFTDNRETAVALLGDVRENAEFVVEVREAEASWTKKVEQAVLMANPEHRRF